MLRRRSLFQDQIPSMCFVENDKNLRERCQRITPLDRPGRREAASYSITSSARSASVGLFRQFGHRNAIWSKRSIATTTTIANIIVSGLSKIDISNDRSEL